MFDLELSEEQQLVRETVASFAANEIRGIARDCDENGSIPTDLAERSFELGLVHSALPENVGGFGEQRSAVTGAIVAEELAWGDAAIAMHLLAPRLVAYPILDAGTPEQREALLPRFCQGFHAASAAVVEPRYDFDTSSFATRARRDGADFVLDGHKCFVPMAEEADLLLVLAQLDDAPAAFIVEKGTAGLEVAPRERNMGFKPLVTNEVKLDAARVPASARLGGDQGFDQARLMARAQVGLASIAVGLARGAYEFARDYAKERTAFGAPIAQKQAVAFMLANMAIEVDASRLLTWEAASKIDSGQDASVEAYRAKRYAARAALKIADDAVQVLGGHGYIRDFPVELWFRNARGFSSFECATLV